MGPRVFDSGNLAWWARSGPQTTRLARGDVVSVEDRKNTGKLPIEQANLSTTCERFKLTDDQLTIDTYPCHPFCSLSAAPGDARELAHDRVDVNEATDRRSVRHRQEDGGALASVFVSPRQGLRAVRGAFEAAHNAHPCVGVAGNGRGFAVAAVRAIVLRSLSRQAFVWHRFSPRSFRFSLASTHLIGLGGPDQVYKGVDSACCCVVCSAACRDRALASPYQAVALDIWLMG